jgi:hypothetical protein
MNGWGKKQGMCGLASTEDYFAGSVMEKKFLDRPSFSGSFAFESSSAGVSVICDF